MRDQRVDERGASAVEYGLLLGAIAAVLIVVLIALGGTVTSLFQHTCDRVNEQVSKKSC